MKDFDLRDLDAFVAVERTSNFRRAESRWNVAGVCGQFTEMMSIRASIWSRLSQ